LIAILAFGTFAAYIPLPALAGVVVLVALKLIDVKEITRIWQVGRGDRVIMSVTFMATLLLPLQFAVLAGILISLAYYLLLTSTPQVRTVVPDESFEYLVNKPENPDCPQLGIIEILGDMYFGAVHHVEDVILENREKNPSQRFLLFRMTGVSHCDISGIHALESVLRTYREAGGDVFVSRYRSPVLKIMHDTGFYALLGDDKYFDRDQNAIGYLFNRVLDPAICIFECPHRVFNECQNLPKRLDLVGEHPYTQIPDERIRYILADELWQHLHEDNPPEVIDVREPREYNRGYVPGAKSFPFTELLEHPQHLPDEGDVILVCRGGRRSTRAASMLQDQTGARLSVLKGGMLAWEAKMLIEAMESD
jgi:SulP family sulfate permease